MQRLEIKGEYAPDWKAISDAAKKAVGYRCVRCGHPFDERGRPLACDAQCDPTRGRRLQSAALTGTPSPHDYLSIGLNYGVHHFDGDKGNNRWWNLLPLCNSCHLNVQARVVPERAFLFAHSEWAKPYIGGFYAWWFAGADEPRERVVALQRFFLAVGQPWLYPDLAEQAREYIAGKTTTVALLQRALDELEANTPDG